MPEKNGFAPTILSLQGKPASCKRRHTLLQYRTAPYIQYIYTIYADTAARLGTVVVQKAKGKREKGLGSRSLPPVPSGRQRKRELQVEVSYGRHSICLLQLLMVLRFDISSVLFFWGGGGPRNAIFSVWLVVTGAAVSHCRLNRNEKKKKKEKRRRRRRKGCIDLLLYPIIQLNRIDRFRPARLDLKR